MTLKYSSGVVAAMLLLSGCGARRYTWVYDRKDLQQSPKTQQKYSIQSFVGLFVHDCGYSFAA